MNQYHKSESFLNDAKAIANKRGYDGNKLHLADNGTHKLMYESPDGKRYFGRLGYGDFLYYSRFQPSIANRKRMIFRRSHGAMSRIYRLGKYSPNELAINILW
jgi:hypothetical protein